LKILRVTFAFLLSVSFVSAQNSSSLQDPPSDLPKLVHFSPDLLDDSLDPCTDFYQYACGKWQAANPIPSDQVAWGVDGPLSVWNETMLGQILKKLSANAPSRTPAEQKIGDFYFACMDTSTIEARSREWLKPELDRVAQIKNKSDLADEIAHLHRSLPTAWTPQDNQTNSVLFGFSAQPDPDDASHNAAQFDQGGMTLPGRSYYLDQDAKSKEIREKYLKHIARMLALAGEKLDAAAANARIVLTFETDLAKVEMDAISRRDPKNTNNKMSLAQIRALSPSFDFDRYLKLVNAPPSQQYVVSSPKFFQGMEAMLQHQSLEHWHTYLRWRVVIGLSPVLNDAFYGEAFDFFGRTLAGAKDMQARWKRCVNQVDSHLGDALGQVYVSRAFSPESKAGVLQMVQDLESALGKDIDSLEWMSADTKAKAHEKVGATLNKIGYPDHFLDYASLPVGRDSFLANRQHAVEFEFERWVAKIGQPVDRGEWTMTPPTINAYSDPPTNTINFPAGILQPPHFLVSQDAALNYGAIGAVIGHEIIHGYDDQGRKYDAQGNLRDWWTAADAKEYEARGKCISDQYTQDIPEAGAGVKQDGRMTLGEDTADNGGIRIAYMGLQSALARQGKDIDAKGPDGLTPRQKFFLSYAFGWCTEYRQELIRQVVLTDPHTYPKYRVINTLADTPEFAVAFGCHKGQREVRENACRVW